MTLSFAEDLGHYPSRKADLCRLRAALGIDPEAGFFMEQQRHS